MKYFVISDIHGDIDGFNGLIDYFNPEKEKLLFIGDLCSRGQFSYELMENAKNIVEAGYGIYLKGNHEFMFLEFIKNPDLAYNYVSDYVGGKETLMSFINQLIIKGYDTKKFTSYKILTEAIKKEFMPLLQFLDNLPIYHEDKDLLFVHAGIPKDIKSVKYLVEDDCIWDSSITKTSHKLDNLVIFGHTPTQNIESANGAVFYDKDKKILAIDGGGFLDSSSASINAVIISTNKNSKYIYNYRYFVKDKVVKKRKIPK